MRRGVRTLSCLFAAGMLAVGACGSDANNTVPVAPGAGGAKGTGGRTGNGSGGSGSTSTGGSSGVSTGGNTGAGGATGGGGSSGAAGGSGAGGTAGSGSGGSGAGGSTSTDGPPAATDTNNTTPPAGGWMGYPGISDLSEVKKTPGCGMPPGQALGSWVPYETMVAIPAGHQGPGGDGRRKYYVKLPAGYDPNKVYKVVIGGSSCENGLGARAIDYTSATTAAGGVIQITPEVEPGVMQEGSYICYDDKDPKSIEYPFIETFLKEVGNKFCYDQNKVFVQGHSSGGWYANMMGCVYGSTLVRGMSSNGGGIARGTGMTPPCHPTNPTAGMWILPMNDDEGRPDTGDALDRALKNNKCEGGGAAGAYRTAPSEPYTAGGGVNCRKFKCPEAFPVIFCQPPGPHGNVGWHQSAAWSMFNALP